jgi:hypothetical protein
MLVHGSMNVALVVYMVILFVALTPGVLVNLPPRCSKYVVLATHALIFAAVWQLTHKAVGRLTEGFAAELGSSCSEDSHCRSNKCRNSTCV